MPDSVARFTISIPPELLATFDEVCASKGYASRSEAIRDAIRDYLIAHEWAAAAERGEVVGTITLVCGSGPRRISEELAERLSRRRTQVLSTLEVPADDNNSVVVLVVKGPGVEVAALADELISLRSVKHGRLVSATTGDAVP
jgi:CopG family nickel-responsive transcriptional regulator